MTVKIKIIKTCAHCAHLWTGRCPLRVWGRNESNAGKNLQVDPDHDYCSRFEQEKPHVIRITSCFA